MKPDIDDVLRTAKEAGLPGYPDELERFYALAYEAGARAEKEQAATMQCQGSREQELTGALLGLLLSDIKKDERGLYSLKGITEYNLKRAVTVSGGNMDGLLDN